jgi:hypothetical protein
MEAIRSSETSVLTRPTLEHITEDGILQINTIFNLILLVVSAVHPCLQLVYHSKTSHRILCCCTWCMITGMMKAARYRNKTWMLAGGTHSAPAYRGGECFDIHRTVPSCNRCATYASAIKTCDFHLAPHWNKPIPAEIHLGTSFWYRS